MLFKVTLAFLDKIQKFEWQDTLKFFRENNGDVVASKNSEMKRPSIEG